MAAPEPTDFIRLFWTAGYGYRTRAAHSEGLLVGALALPWAFAGLLSSTSRLHAHPGALFACCLHTAVVTSCSISSLR